MPMWRTSVKPPAADRAVPPGADVPREPEETLPRLLHLGEDGGAVYGDAGVRAAPEGHVERGPALGRVDPLPPEQRFAPGGQVHRLGEGEEGSERRPVHLLLGEVDEQVFVAERERGEPPRLPREQGAEGEGAQPCPFAFDRAPSRVRRVGHSERLASRP